ncbi:DNA methyltransferase [Halobium palmae]|uniref:DNA methyltransferase n=1 Tax=Halobium palmae TaxID=1776492 RepID=A0ABD5RXN2_9EURY
MGDERLGFDDITPDSALENDIPYRQLNRLAELEAYNKHHYRPTNYQHKWWARRLGSVFRTLNIAALSAPDTTAEELWEKVTDTCDFEDAVVFDPFMGGGTTGQEATRVGAKFVGSDLNPVAWFITRMGLAPQTSLLETYFRRVMNRSRDEIRPYYRTRCPSCGDAVGAQFYLWVTLEGDGDRNTRAYDTLVVDHDRNGGATVVCPACHGISEVDDPEAACCGECERSFDATEEDVRVPVDAPNAVFNGGERPAYEPYAVKYHCKDCGESGFREFGEFDVDRLEAARERYEELRGSLPIPEQEIPEGGEKTRDLHNRNYTEWTQLFNSRQLLALGTLLDNITEVDDELARHYLTLTFSATLEFNNMFCSYKGADPRGPGAVRHLFSHHAYVHPGEPLENNPIGTKGRQSGTFRYLYEYRLKKALDYQHTPVERVLNDDGTVEEKKPIVGEEIGGRPADSVSELLDGDRTHFLHCGDSADLPFADELAGGVDAVITDPPYYDSVQYGELADFFYVWQKQSLERDFPEIFSRDSVVSDAEAVGNRTREKSLDDYRELLQNVFESSFDLLKEDGPLAFTFHHKQPEAWGAVLEAIDGAGFRVVNTYPVRGENRLSVHIKGQRAVLLDSVIVCRKDHKKPEGDWGDIRGTIEEVARERIRTFHGSDDDDLSRLDASVVAYGACTTEYSKYETVTDDEDDEVSERDAMEIIQPLIDELNEAEF